MALLIEEKNDIIRAVNADLPEEQIPYLDDPDGMELYQELMAAREMGVAAFNLLEEEEDPDEGREWEHQAIQFIRF
ncbi:MAG: hypothetical protein LUE11_06430 [Clostridia bacterium]|nr:hypothetical protein [Clostridia bacterium]